MIKVYLSHFRMAIQIYINQDILSLLVYSIHAIRYSKT
ncbi:hypothetical protein F383_24999 [Gossypium arboreum]|uniref:Uncharacterized protein n=1 Tax=Gossypium arboreum TaxID=29729 RepID=A0A0B0P391_GOSAR|nr:hypothetical protein F383_24999 [Gossypium arboreum]